MSTTSPIGWTDSLKRREGWVRHGAQPLFQNVKEPREWAQALVQAGLDRAGSLVYESTPVGSISNSGRKDNQTMVLLDERGVTILVRWRKRPTTALSMTFDEIDAVSGREKLLGGQLTIEGRHANAETKWRIALIASKGQARSFADEVLEVIRAWRVAGKQPGVRPSQLNGTDAEVTGDRPPFWETARGNNVEVLYNEGIEYVQRDDFRGMIATGWRIMQLDGLHVAQSEDFIRDGWLAWQLSDEFETSEARAFLAALLGTLDENPIVPYRGNDVEKARGDYYGVRCWAAMYDYNMRDEDKQRGAELFEMLTAEPQRNYLTGQAKSWVRQYTSDNNLDPPFR